jgi:predicted DNA-binding protein (MmcQ/YjbR family)
MAITKKTIERIRKVCLSFPETEEKSFGGHTAPAFRVRDKLFVMTSEDGTTLTCKTAPGVQQILVGSNPAEFFVPKYVGAKGWVGVTLGAVTDWEEIDELLEESYRLIAPKRLVALLDDSRASS